MEKDIIFDFDGVLADTEELCYQANEYAFEIVNHQFTRQEYARLWVVDGLDLEDIVERFGFSVDPKLLRVRKNNCFAELLKKERLGFMSGARNLIDELLKRDARLSIASSNLRSNIELFLEIENARDCFSLIMGREDIEYPKPHPDIFLKTLERLDIDSQSAIVVEDAPKGVKAARAANISTIAIPNTWTRGADFSEADVVVSEPSEIISAIQALNSRD